MEPTYLKYIFKYSWRQQIYLLTVTCISFPFLYYTLELPKIIINEAIGSSDFPKDFAGQSLAQIEYLMALCLLFLFFVIIRFGLRYHLNVRQGQLGERMLRRLRYDLFSRILRFPLPHFRKTSQGELIAMVTAEVEPLGGFVGDVLALPAFQGGTLLTILVFMFMQDWVLGAAAIALFPVQIYIIPKLQKQINVLAKERVRTVRKLSERVGEVVSGIEDVHAHNTAELERADVARWLGTIYQIRYKIYRKKFFVKFLNNLISQLTPFFFFSIGGYLVIQGELTFGALVAVLAAYKDVSAPWKELLSWYQQKEDTRVKYEQLVEQFVPPGLIAAELQQLPDGEVPHLSGPVTATNLTYAEEEGVRILDGVSFSFDLDDRVAIVGREGAGHSTLGRLIARLLVPTAGAIRIGDSDLATLPQYVTGRRIGYVGQTATVFQGTVRDNLFYGLKHEPSTTAAEPPGDASHRDWLLHEALQSGNTTSDIEADWIDYEAAGAQTPAALIDRAIAVLLLADTEKDIFGFGLQSSLDSDVAPDLAAKVLEARAMLRQRLKERDYAGLVEPFDRNAYNQNMTVAENILFGTPIGPAFQLGNIAEHPYMLSVLEQVGLTERFLDVGLRAARIMVDLFQDVGPGDDIFERFSFISAEVLPAYQAVIRHAETSGERTLSSEDRALVLSLPFKLVPARHRLGLLDEQIEVQLLEARRVFAEGLPDELRDAVAFFDPDAYNPAASIQDNILFGRLVYGRPQSQRLIGTLIEEVVGALRLRRAIVAQGLEYRTGISGSRLSAAQRVRLVIARTLLKRPDLLIVDQALAGLDPGTQTTIMSNILNGYDGGGQVWIVGEARDVSAFDEVIVLEHGRIAERRTAKDAAQETAEETAEETEWLEASSGAE